MKNWFLVSLAIFAFVVSCGKKDKKKGQIGKTVAGKLDCAGKDKQNKACPADASNQNGGVSGDLAQEKIVPSGGDPKVTSETIPNLKDLNKMSIMLSKNTSLVAEMKIDSENSKESVSKVVCTDVKDLAKLDDVVETNPDELKSITSQFILFNGSSIVTHLKVNKGDQTKPTKLYMLTCNSGSEATVADYANSESVETKALKLGQQAFELVTLKDKESGVLTSFECGDDEAILKDSSKSVGKKVANRVRIRQGSAVLVYRATDVKIGEKKLSELGSDAQKKKQYTILSCNG